MAAFITFETQEGYERACNIKGKRNWKREVVSAEHRFLGDFVSFEEAPEPTNIIWENRDKTFKEQTKRKVVVVVVIIVLLLAAFFAFYLLKQQTIRNQQKYPSTTNCQAVYDMFGGSLDNPDFSKFAEADGPLAQHAKGTGLYYCYCKQYVKTRGGYSGAAFC